MILNNAPQNEAILSNVGQVGEFRIRNSAKAFSILSSGLYANKIRAIIRELSCNAVDSHTSAGKLSTPFDVHLPNSLEPWFSIRDYGTGLTHDQVTNLYTTYFESTKTDSNAFIGALGLGSKSPFSYTDNFTVTAVKNGVRGIYTAFINEMGVPSIALMTQGETTEPNGVEVKFSVNSQQDYQKFISEAKQVFKHFKLRPVISGCDNFEFTDTEYNEKNLIPGVHRIKYNSHYGMPSVAIMGNIEYPIQVPESETKALGDLALMLNCGLRIEFGIGELDFQASREGLSYVGITLQSIKSKLTQLRDSLLVRVTDEAVKLDNLWERAIYLATKLDDKLYTAAVKEHLNKTKFDLVKDDRYNKLKSWILVEKVLANTYNLKIRAGYRTRSEQKCTTVQPTHDYNNQESGDYYTVSIDSDSYFVITDTKRGAFERAKYHWRNKAFQGFRETFFVLEPVDKTKPMLTDEFFTSISNPPSKQILLASSLTEKPRKVNGNRTSILVIEERRRAKSRHTTWVWSNDGNLEDYDNKKTYYYVPLFQFQPETKSTAKDFKTVYEMLRLSGVYSEKLYGVNKRDIEQVKKKKNWIHIDELVIKNLTTQNATTAKSLAKSSIDFNPHFKDNVVSLVKDTNSPFKQLYQDFKGVESKREDHNITLLMNWYGIKDAKDMLEAERKVWVEKIFQVRERYPLLVNIGYSTSANLVAEYINMVDQVKGN
jgi:hypothetical protein